MTPRTVSALDAALSWAAAKPLSATPRPNPATRVRLVRNFSINTPVSDLQRLTPIAAVQQISLAVRMQAAIDVRSSRKNAEDDCASSFVPKKYVFSAVTAAS
jgi:hypothetical protein